MYKRAADGRPMGPDAMATRWTIMLRCKRLAVLIFTAFLLTLLTTFTMKNSYNLVVPMNQLVPSLPTPKSRDFNVTSTTEGNPKCRKKLTVAFLKVHKAGSTTIMNIFLRFAVRNNLNIALPRRSSGYGFNYLGYGKTLNKSNIVPLPVNETYSILCNHVVYSKESFDSVMPPGSAYVAIIREPKSHFISASQYYGFAKHLGKFYKMKSNSASAVLNRFLIKDSKYSHLPMFYVHNRQSFDFGLNKTKFNDLNAVESYIRKLDSEFQLVMLMEYFDESLVMLRRILCWDVKDVLYVPLNVNRKAKREHVKLSTLAEEYLHRFNYADFRLYDYFKLRFMQRLKLYGQDLQDEVDFFRDLRTRVSSFCLSRGKGVLQLPASLWSSPFNVTIQDCIQMTMPELPMLHRLIDVANERYNSWRKNFINEEGINS